MTFYSLIKTGEACGLDMSKVKMFVYLLEHTNPETREVNESYDSIARAAGVSYSTAAKLMQTMQEDKMIQMIGKGKWKWTEQLLAGENDGDDEKLAFYVKNYRNVNVS